MAGTSSSAYRPIEALWASALAWEGWQGAEAALRADGQLSHFQLQNNFPSYLG